MHMYNFQILYRKKLSRRTACTTISSLAIYPAILLGCRFKAQEGRNHTSQSDPSVRQNFSDAEKDACIHQATRRILRRLKKLAPGLNEDDYHWLAKHYANTAVNVASQHGKQGLLVLRLLGLEGLEVMRNYPKTFEELVPHFGGPTAARMLVLTKKYFVRLAKQGGLPKFLEKLKKLPPRLQTMAVQHPQWTPYLVVGGKVVYEALKMHPDLCGRCFPLVDLSQGPEGIQKISRLILRLGDKIMPWFNARGIDGLLLADSFEPLLNNEVGDLKTFLGILHCNQADLAPQVRDGNVDQVRDAIGRIFQEDAGLPLPNPDARKDHPCRGDLLRLACIDEHMVRFVMEYPKHAFELIKTTWMSFLESGVSLPSLLYDGYEDPSMPKLKRNAFCALLEHKQQRHDIYHTLVLMADFPQQELLDFKHPRADRFRELLAKLDYRVVAYLGEAEMLPNNLRESRYKLLEGRKKDALDEWQTPPSFWKETLPFYDVCRLVWVLSQGYTPTWGEVTFAAIDVGFSIWDLATAGAGKAATASAKQGLKKITRETIRVSSRSVTRAVRTVGRKKAQQVEQRVFATIIGKLAASPKVLNKLWRDQVFTRTQKYSMRIPFLVAEKTANRMRIPLIKRSKRILKLVFTEWKWNIAIAGGIKGLVEIAENIPADSPAAKLCAEKVQEVLLTLEQPIG